MLESTVELSAAVEKAEQRGVVVYSISTMSDGRFADVVGDHAMTGGRRISALARTGAAMVTNSSDGLRQLVEKYLGMMTECWSATFDVRALHGAQDVALTIDGKATPLTRDGKPTDFVHALLAPAQAVWWTSRALQIGVGLLLVALVALALRWRFRARAR